MLVRRCATQGKQPSTDPGRATIELSDAKQRDSRNNAEWALRTRPYSGLPNEGEDAPAPTSARRRFSDGSALSLQKLRSLHSPARTNAFSLFH